MRFCLFLVLSLMLASCSSAVGSSVAFLVSKNSEIKAKRNKRYSVLSKCLYPDNPDAFALSEAIENGAPITEEQNRLLNELEEDAELPPFPKHHISYAFLVIAERMDDARALDKKEEYQLIYPKDELKDIEELMRYKYYLSYLKKCFSVPKKYQLHTPIREHYLR